MAVAESAPETSSNAHPPNLPGAAMGLTTMRALAKFKSGASAESRERKRTLGAQLRAELPPGHLPDDSKVSIAKRLSRAMAKDGMTAGDR